MSRSNLDEGKKIATVKLSQALHKKLLHMKIDRGKRSIDELLDELLTEAGY